MNYIICCYYAILHSPLPNHKHTLKASHNVIYHVYDTRRSETMVRYIHYLQYKMRVSLLIYKGKEGKCLWIIHSLKKFHKKYLDLLLGTTNMIGKNKLENANISSFIKSTNPLDTASFVCCLINVSLLYAIQNLLLSFNTFVSSPSSVWCFNKCALQLVLLLFLVIYANITSQYINLLHRLVWVSATQQLDVNKHLG